MTRPLAALVLLAACSLGEDRTLVLEGPAQVKVDHLGVVQGPSVVLSDGSAPEGLVVSAAPETVATVDGNVVTAVGPGEATVTAAWQEQQVAWSLTVAPRVSLSLVEPPATLAVGDRRPLHVQARIGEQNVDPGEVAWSSSAPDVATVAASGEVTAVAPGTTYIIAKQGTAEAMAEIQVVAAE